MSVVAVKVYDDKIVVTADSIVCRGWSKTTNGDFSKIHRDNGMIIGAVGSAQEASIMWHYMSTHKPSAGLKNLYLNLWLSLLNGKTI